MIKDLVVRYKETDREGEAADSWHSRPVFYTGGGNGYSGRPEDGDTLYLYFPTEQEEERSVIGGASAGQMALQAVTQQIMDDTASDEEAVQKEQMQQIGVGADDSGGTVHEALSISQGAGGSLPKADAANMTSYKNWTTPGEQGISLNPAGIRTYNRTGSFFRMGSSGISMTGSGDAALKGKNGLEISMLQGKQIRLSAKGYIYIQCGMSAVALLPEEIHIKGTEVILDSPLNEATEALPDKESIEALKEIYHEAKWGSPLQLFMPDGTAIGRVYGLEEDEALRRYFDENIIGTEGYARYLCTPELQQLYDDGVLDDAGEEVYNDNLYWKWLTETYGKTDWQRFEDWLMTKEGRHTALDAVGFVFDAADLVNGALYLMERDWGGAALSLVCAIPLVGSLVVGGVKGGRYLLKRGKTLIDASGLAKLEKDAKVMKELDGIKLFFYARKADWEDISRYIKRLGEQLGDLAGDGRYAELVTPDGYRIPVSKDLKIDIKMMDEMGDTLEDALQVGEKLGDGSGNLKVQNGISILLEGGNTPDELLKAGYSIDDLLKGGFTPNDLPGYQHLVEGDGLIRKKAQVNGGHNIKSFYAAIELDAQKLGLEISDYNIEVKSHPTIKGLYQIKYDIPKVNGNTDPITPLYDEMGKVLTKPADDVKTVYNTAEIGFSDIEIYKMGKQAL